MLESGALIKPFKISSVFSPSLVMCSLSSVASTLDSAKFTVISVAEFICIVSKTGVSVSRIKKGTTFTSSK